jgi:hypothetical protein
MRKKQRVSQDSGVYLSVVPQITAMNHHHNDTTALLNVAENVNHGIQAVVGTSAAGIGIASSLSNSVKPVAGFISIFAPLFNVVVETADCVLELCRIAEHNRQTCNSLLRRVLSAKAAIQPMQIVPNDGEFFSEANYKNMQHLVTVMKDIKTFVEHVSQTKGLTKLDR